MEEPETELCKNCKKLISSANFQLHYVHCKRNLKVCKICKEPVQKSEQQKHLEEYHVSVTCKMCDEPQEKWMLSKHKEVCPKRLVPCEFCEADISHDELPEHENFCGSRTEKCFTCHSRIMKKDFKAHLESHRQPSLKDNKNKEVQQNKLNEEICKTAVTNKPKRHEKVSTSRDRNATLEPRTCDTNEQPESSMLEGAAAPSPDKKKKVPKNYYPCEICQENIAWEDVRKHLPNCADAFGKCRICLKSVPPDEMRSHLNSEECLRYLEDNKSGLNAYGYFENDYEMQPIEVQRLEPCLHCRQLCSRDRIAIHIESCSENKSVHADRAKHASVQTYARQSTVYEQTYECPLCNEEMPEENKKMHESFYCKVLLDLDQPNSLYSMPDVNTSNKSPKKQEEGFVECPCCCEKFSVYKIQEHTEGCLRDRKPCEYCEEMIHISQELSHLKNCRKLPSSQGTESYAQPTDNPAYIGKEMEHFEECPCCCGKFSVFKIKEHIEECLRNRKPCDHCKEMIDESQEHLHLKKCPKLQSRQGTKSYAQAANKPACRKKDMTLCGMCKKEIPKHELFAHHETCTANRKASCVYCSKEINQGTEAIHLRTCSAFNRPKNVGNGASRYAHRNKFEVTGAVPKYSRVPPKMGVCKYCRTTYNADILVYHEAECVHQEVKCPDCPIVVSLKDLEKHKCKSKGKKNKGDQKTDGNSIASTIINFFSKFEPPKSLDDYQNSRNDVFESYAQRNSYSSVNLPQDRNQKFDSPTSNGSYYPPGNLSQSNFSENELYFSQPFLDNTEIPCEFCNKSIPASKLIEHETGCKPEVVSFAKASADKDKKTTPMQNEELTEEKFFSANDKRFMPSTKYETIKERITSSGTNPGEFLNVLSRPAEINVFPNDKGESVEKTAPRTLKSVWNNDSSESEAEELENSETQCEDGQEKMQQDVNESEKELLDDVEMRSESDDEVTNILAFINEKTSESSNMLNERTEKLDDSEKEKEDDMNARVEDNLSSQQNYCSEDVAVLKNKETFEDESFEPKKSSKFVRGSGENVPDVNETKTQQFGSFKFGSYKMMYPAKEEVNSADFTKDNICASKLNEERLALCKTVDSSEHEKKPFQKAYNYILNAPSDNSDPNSKPVSDMSCMPKSDGTDLAEEDSALLHEEYLCKLRREIEDCKSELNADNENFAKEGAPCEFCKIEWPPEEYEAHTDFCGSLTVKCNLCKKYIKKRDRKMHAQFHLNENEKNMEQEVRKKESYAEKQEISEKKTHHDQLITCRFCNVNVPLKSFLVHTDACSSSGYQCKICKKYVKNRDRKSHSQMHLDEKEREEKESAKQDNVKKSYPQKQDIPEEKTYHEQLITCGICKVDVPLKSYRVHRDICDFTTYKCEICKEYVKESDRKIHSQMHSEEKEREKKESAKQDNVKKSYPQKQDMPGEMSKYYTTCRICHQIVAWIDYNTHVPMCASNAGKCSRCGDTVANEEMKEHVLKKCPMIKQSKPEQNDMSEYIERGKHFYEKSVKSFNEYSHSKQQSQALMPKHNPKEVPTTDNGQKPASNRRKSIESKNPAFTLEPAENYSRRSIIDGSERDRKNNSWMEKRMQGSYPSTAESLEKWAKWCQKE